MSEEKKGNDSSSDDGFVVLTAEEITDKERMDRLASDRALSSATLPANVLMASFHGQHAVDGDKLFQHQDSIEITPGVGSLSSFLVKVDWRSLAKGNIFALMKGEAESTFEQLVVVGIFQVIEDAPLQFQYVETLAGEIIDVPEVITLHNTKSVFAWNERGVAMIHKDIIDQFPRAVLNFQHDTRRSVSYMNNATLGADPPPPPVSSVRVDSFKAMQSADR